VCIKVKHLDIHVTEIYRTTEVPHFFTGKLLGVGLRLPLVEKDRAVEDVLADADVNESVLHVEMMFNN